MAVTAITPIQLVLNVASADLPDAAGTVATTPSDGWTITPGAGVPIDKLIFRLLADASGDTVTFLAGDKPPSELAGLGNLAVVLAASDVKQIVIEAARFMQDDATIRVTCVDAGTSLICFAMPKGALGGSAVA